MTKAAAALLVVVLALATEARATDCRPTLAAGPALAAIDAETRLQFVSGRLDAAARASKIWTGSWIGIYGALTVGSLALVPGTKREQRVDWYFSAGTSMVGLLSLAVSPLRSIPDAAWLRARRAKVSDVCALIADAERLLVRDAQSEQDCQKLILHIGNVVLNFGSLMVLGFVFRRWEAAALQGVAGTLIGEIMIVSTPKVASDALDAYRTGNLTVGKSAPRVALIAAPMPLQNGAGIALGGSF